MRAASVRQLLPPPAPPLEVSTSRVPRRSSISRTRCHAVRCGHAKLARCRGQRAMAGDRFEQRHAPLGQDHTSVLTLDPDFEPWLHVRPSLVLRRVETAGSTWRRGGCRRARNIRTSRRRATPSWCSALFATGCRTGLPPR